VQRQCIKISTVTGGDHWLLLATSALLHTQADVSRGMVDLPDRVADELVQHDERWWINEAGRKNA